MLTVLPLVGLASLLLQAAPPSRAVAAPPSDLESGLLRLEDPARHAVRSRAAWIDVRALEGPLAFDDAAGLQVALVAPDPRGLELLARIAGTPWRDARALPGVARASQVLDEPLRGWAIERFAFPSGGALELAPRGGTGPAYLVVRDGAPAVLGAWLSDWTRVAGEPLALMARLEGAPAGAQLTAVFEDALGAHAVPLADLGDGTHAAALPAELSGPVHARVEARAGAHLRRTALLSFTLHEKPLLLTGAVALRALSTERVELALEAVPLAHAARVLVAAELWGRDARGEARPICWLARLQALREGGTPWELALELDLRWPAHAGLSGPFELRGVRVQDADTFGVLETRDALALPTLPAWSGGPVPAVLPAMLGFAPAPTPPAASHQALDRALMLVHGYCSGGNVWPAADFTQPKQVFLDPNQNRTHDQFAQLLGAAGAARDSFGVVGHSQGGAAALHLLTFYESPLDHALGPRRIQSVATPYQGTPLASLGAFACGVNNDMTPSGSAAWLANVPSWARAEVSYWTTSDAGSACNFLTSLFLTDPEDGTVEKFRGQLPGGNDMGHVAGWCHTTGMSYPANYTDHVRNQAMDAAAAR